MSKYNINGIGFSSKEGIRLYVSEIAKKYRPGKSITGDDFFFMRELLNSHEGAEEKIGCGVISIEVEIEPEWKTRAFYLTRLDGSRTDFSYRKCIGIAPPDTPIKLFTQAARNSIAPIVTEFKNNYFSGNNTAICQVTFEIISFEQAQVDHAPPMRFKNIVDGFISDTLIDLDGIRYTGFSDMQVTRKFADEKLEKMFIAYHNKYANLRVVSGKWNMGAEAKR